MGSRTADLSLAINQSLEPSRINQFLVGKDAARKGAKLFSCDAALDFATVVDQAAADRLIDAMEAQADYSDPLPFHEWIDYGLNESTGALISLSNGQVTAGFVVFDLSIRTAASGPIDKIELFIEVERLYVAGKLRNKGYGRALLAPVIMKAEAALVSGVKAANAKRVRHVAIHLDGDSLSPTGTRLFNILSSALENIGVSLLQKGDCAEFRILNMTSDFHGEE
jgi:GNAT superfamily N-acetyltransferase